MKTGFFNSEKIEDFKRKFPDHSNQFLAEYFMLSINTVKSYAYQLGLEKSEKYISMVRSGVGTKGSDKRWKQS